MWRSPGSPYTALQAGAPNGRLQRRFPFWRPHARELGRPILRRVPLLLVRSPRSLVHSLSIAYFAPLDRSSIDFWRKKTKNKKFREFKNFHKTWKKVQELIKKFRNLKKSSSIKKNRFWKMKILNMRTNVSKIVRKFQISFYFKRELCFSKTGQFSKFEYYFCTVNNF